MRVAADVSPIQLDEWPQQTRVGNPFLETPSDTLDTEAEREFRDSAKEFLALPDECCLGVANVDPILTKFDILEALQVRLSLTDHSLPLPRVALLELLFMPPQVRLRLAVARSALRVDGSWQRSNSSSLRPRFL